jgi:hypothetical protein
MENENGVRFTIDPLIEPVVEEPALLFDTIYPEEPAVAEEPAVEEPAVEEPAVEEPAVEEPVVEEPSAVEEPVVEEPAVEEQAAVEEPALLFDTIYPEEPNIPKVVFIVPYRDRAEHLAKFSRHMRFILHGLPGYRIYYIHQLDKRGFNRGAMKNIGFRMVRNKWPNDYKSITLVFNDIDTMPKTHGLIDYETSFGKIKHFYGFDYTLGGIVSIKAGDFEMINGFPNFWTWGFEDNMLQQRAKKAGLIIDRSHFYKFGDDNIINISHSNYRLVNRVEFNRYIKSTNEGVSYINSLVYAIDETTGFINVHQFNTGYEESILNTVNYDLRNGANPFPGVFRTRKTAAMPMYM